MNRRYRINEPAVAAEMHEGDAILINFENGRYYDTSGAGGEIVRLLMEGHAAGEIARALAKPSAQAQEEVTSAVCEFIDALLAEALVVPGDAGAQTAAPVAIVCLLPAGFVAPALNRHVELEDLLKLDPIHDTDADGWPLPKSRDRP